MEEGSRKIKYREGQLGNLGHLYTPPRIYDHMPTVVWKRVQKVFLKIFLKIIKNFMKILKIFMKTMKIMDSLPEYSS